MTVSRFLGAALLTATAASQSADAQTLVPFKDAKLPFTVSLPKGWLGADFGDGALGLSLVSAKAPPATLIRLLFTPKNGAVVNLNSEFQKFEAGIKASGASTKQLSSRSVRYGGVSGAEREYTLSHPGGQLRMRVWYGNGAKNLYSFQLTDSPARFTQANALFGKVLSSLRFN